jgi:hypothetical protein
MYLNTNKGILGLSIIFLILFFCPLLSRAQNDSSAIIRALEGEVSLVTGIDQTPPQLSTNTVIKPWDVVRTGIYSKVFAETNFGPSISMGEYGSFFLSVFQTSNNIQTEIQMTEGIMRISGNSQILFSIMTPNASIKPNLAGNYDFIVQTPTATSTIVTVLQGSVDIEDISNPGINQLVKPCETLYVDQNKSTGMDKVASIGEDVRQLISMTTITGTLASNLDICAPQTRVSVPQEVYSSVPQYYYEDWDVVDPFPFQQVTILPPRSSGAPVYVIIPGIGRWMIPVEIFDGWTVDPVVVEIYVKQVIFNKVIHFDRYWLNDLRTKRHQLENLIYLAQVSGDRSALINAQRELDFLRIREKFASKRIQNLEHRVRDLELKDKEFSGRLPRGANFYQKIDRAFTSPNNVNTYNTFKTKTRNDFDYQSKIAGIAGREVRELKNQLGIERDPHNRLVLNNELMKFQKEMLQGKLPLNVKNPEIRQVITQIAKERDPQKLEKLQQKLAHASPSDMPRSNDFITADQLSGLQKRVKELPNPQLQQDFERKVTDLQRSVDEVKKAERNFDQIEKLSHEAATTRDPNTRKRLLDQLENVTKQIPSGAPGSIQLMNRLHGLESQLTLENDRQKREQLQKLIDDQQHQQSELFKNQREDQRIRTERLKQIQDDRSTLDKNQKDFDEKRKLDSLRHENEEKMRMQQQQLDKNKTNLEDQKHKTDDLKSIQEQQTLDKLKHDQDENRKKTEEQKRLFDQQQQLDKNKRNLEDQKHKTDELRKFQEQQSDKIKYDQERLRLEELKKQDIKKQQDEDVRKRDAEKIRQDQLHRQQLEIQQQNEQLRLKEDKRRSDELRLREDQNRRDQDLKKQQQEQLRIQQQMDQTRKQQELMRNQQEQVKQEQLRNEQLRKQQEEERHRSEQLRMQQLEQQRNDQLRRQQEDQSRKQQEMMRLQQDQMRKQQDDQRRQQDIIRQQQDAARQQEIMRKQMEEQRKREEDQKRK